MKKVLDVLAYIIIGAVVAAGVAPVVLLTINHPWISLGLASFTLSCLAIGWAVNRIWHDKF